MLFIFGFPEDQILIKLTLFFIVTVIPGVVKCANIQTSNVQKEDPLDGLWKLVNVIGAQEGYCSLFIAHEQGTQYKIPLDKIVGLEDKWRSVQIIEENSLIISNNATTPCNDESYWFSWLEPERYCPSKKHHTATCGILVMICFIPERCPNLLRQVARLVTLSTRHHKLIIWGSNVEDLLTHTDFSHFLYKIGLLQDKSSSSVILKSVCFFCANGEPEVVTLGHFHPGQNRFDPPNFNIFPDFTFNLRNKYLEGVYMYPYSPQTVRYNRAHMLPVFQGEAVLADIAESMNFDWNIKVFSMTDNAVDTQLPDGRWVGMIAEVLYGRSILSGPTAMTERGVKIIDYTPMFLKGHVTFIRRKPFPLYTWKSVFKPYTLDMWLLILASCILVTVLFRGLLYIVSSFTDPFSPKKPPRNVWSYSTEYIFSPLIEENPTLIPTSHSVRMFLALWWLYAIIISFAYDTKLISFLVSPEYEEVPHIYPELINFPGWSWGKGKEHMVFFKMLTESSELYYHKILVDGAAAPVESIVECIIKAIDENYACIAYHVYLKVVSMTHLYTDGYNPLDLSDDISIGIDVSFILPKYSVLLPVFTKKTHAILASGLVQYYSDMFFYTSFWQGLLSARKANKVRNLSMALIIDQLKGPMLILGICHTITILSFIYELVQEKLRKKKDLRLK